MEKKITPWIFGEKEDNTVSKSRELHLRLPPTTGTGRRADPCLSPPWGMPWVRLKLSAFLWNLRNLSRDLLPNVYSQAVLFINFSRILYLITYLYVLSCRQSLSPAIQKTSIPVAQIKLHCFSSQLSQFLTERDQTWPC